MNTVEPLLFTWEGKGIGTDDNYQRRTHERNWDETADYLLHKSATELCDEVSTYTLQEKYSDIVESETQQILDVLPDETPGLQIGGTPNRGRRTGNAYYVRGETVVVPSRLYPGLVRIVSNNKNAARDLLGKLTSEIGDLAEQFHGAGVNELHTYEGEEYTKRLLDHPSATLNISIEQPEGFEESVLESLKPQSQGFASNIRVDFEGYSQNHEFDILYAISPRELIQIEVKDYSGTDDEPGEKDVIHRPYRKASLLNITHTIVVVKGVPEDTLTELQENAELRNNFDIINKSELEEVTQPILEASISDGRGGKLRTM